MKELFARTRSGLIVLARASREVSVMRKGKSLRSQNLWHPEIATPIRHKSINLDSNTPIKPTHLTEHEMKDATMDALRQSRNAHQHLYRVLSQTHKEGLHAMSDSRWDDAEKIFDDVISAVDNERNGGAAALIDLSHMSPEERQLISAIYTRQASILIHGTFEEEALAKTYYHKALEYDSDNKDAKLGLKALALDEAAGKLSV